jgi:hypothetical protein
MRTDGYYWVKHPKLGWHIGYLRYGHWHLAVGPASTVYKYSDFEEISSRIKYPDEEDLS